MIPYRWWRRLMFWRKPLTVTFSNHAPLDPWCRKRLLGERVDEKVRCPICPTPQYTDINKET